MKIKIQNVELNVSNFYPYRYPDGKLVLRFDVNKKDMDFAELYQLLNENKHPIEYYETDEEKPVCTYYGYSEFTCNYERGKYSVEQVTPSHLNSAVELLLAEREEKEQVIRNQENTIALLTQCVIEMSEEIYKEGDKT